MDWASILCAKCLNPQPIFRKCSMCDVKTYYTCVGEDCWDVKAASPGKIPFWMCYNCQPEYNKENQNPNEVITLQQKKYATELLSDEETDGTTGKKREYIKGKRVGKNNYFTMEFTASSDAQDSYQKKCSKCGNTQPVFRGCTICQSRNYYTCVSPDCWDLPETSPIWICYLCKYDHEKFIKKSVTHPQEGKSEEIEEIFDINNSECESEIQKTDKTKCESEISKNEEQFTGVLQASEEFTSVRNKGIAEAKRAVQELDQQIIIREIEEAMSENYEDSYTGRNFKELQKFWEGLSSGNCS